MNPCSMTQQSHQQLPPFGYEEEFLSILSRLYFQVVHQHQICKEHEKYSKTILASVEALVSRIDAVGSVVGMASSEQFQRSVTRQPDAIQEAVKELSFPFNDNNIT